MREKQEPGINVTNYFIERAKDAWQSSKELMKIKN